MSRAESPEHAASEDSSDNVSTVSSSSETDPPGKLSPIPPSTSVASLVIGPHRPRKRPAHINNLPPEIVREIFRMIDSTQDRLAFMLVQRQWLSLAMGTVWMRPTIASLATLDNLSSLLKSAPQCIYARLVRRLNLNAVSSILDDQLLESFTQCTNLERLVLTGARSVSEEVICRLISSNKRLHSLDLLDTSIGDQVAYTISQSCPELTSLFLGGTITDTGLSTIIQHCPLLKRLKLAGCPGITRKSLREVPFACPQLAEFDISALDISNTGQAQQPPTTIPTGEDNLRDSDLVAMLPPMEQLRDLRIDGNRHVSRDAFETMLVFNERLDNLRLLSLAMCPSLTDSAVLAITKVAPRLRHMVLNKCPSITDRSLQYIADAYGPNLQYIHLGHCVNLTDQGISILAEKCPRLLFVDVANCTNLTNQTVRELAKLPRLRRIGLVKCSQIDDDGIVALTERAPQENMLERIHLSYCLEVSVEAISCLLNACPKLTHLSLTGVTSFLRHDLMQFCREAPPDLTQHQQQMFCVYSGQGVWELREFLNHLVQEEEEDLTHISPGHQTERILMPSLLVPQSATNEDFRLADRDELHRISRRLEEHRLEELFRRFPPEPQVFEGTFNIFDDRPPVPEGPRVPRDL